MTAMNVIQPSIVHETVGYSHAVRLGNVLFVSGQVAKDRDGDLIGRGDVRAQTRQVLQNLRDVLEASGSALESVAKITIFTTSLEHRATIGEVREEFFGAVGHRPASTFVVVSSLADPNFLVEIEAVAGL
jgi:2-iminobutanoate/2-iminopropanoate deaminase